MYILNIYIIFYACKNKNYILWKNFLHYVIYLYIKQNKNGTYTNIN